MLVNRDPTEDQRQHRDRGHAVGPPGEAVGGSDGVLVRPGRPALRQAICWEKSESRLPANSLGLCPGDHFTPRDTSGSARTGCARPSLVPTTASSRPLAVAPYEIAPNRKARPPEAQSEDWSNRERRAGDQRQVHCGSFDRLAVLASASSMFFLSIEWPARLSFQLQVFRHGHVKLWLIGSEIGRFMHDTDTRGGIEDPRRHSAIRLGGRSPCACHGSHRRCRPNGKGESFGTPRELFFASAPTWWTPCGATRV